jgi:hypothetical protein
LSSDSRPDFTKEAIHFLVNFPEKRATPHFAVFTNYQTKELRLEAVWGLGRINDDVANRILLSFLNDPDEEVRIEAALKISRLSDRNKIIQLLQTAQSRDFRKKRLPEKRAILVFLGRSRTQEAFNFLKKVLQKWTSRQSGEGGDEDLRRAGWRPWRRLRPAKSSKKAPGHASSGSGKPARKPWTTWTSERPGALDMSRPEGRRRSRSDQYDKVLHQTGVDILIRLHIVYKIVKLYERNNEMYAAQGRSLYEVLNGVLSQQTEAAIKVREGAVFFNGIRLKFILATYPIFRFMLEEFQKREIGALVFQPGLTEEELLRFIFVLAKKEKGARIPFDEMLTEAQEADLPHIGLEKAVTEQPLSLNKNTAKIYFLSILHLRSLERDKRNERIKLNTTRRLMQAIFNHTDNETFIFG